MLSYQHQYHAGNFADIHKHLTLIATQTLLNQKKKKLSIIETHAGNGLYRLNAPESLRTKEAQTGILNLQQSLAPIQKRSDQIKAERLTTSIQRYIEIIDTVNSQKHPAPWQYYPGSPMIAAQQLASEDHWIGYELHPQAHADLVQSLSPYPNTHIHRQDSLTHLKGVIPTLSSRALFLIDPSYEQKTDYEKIPALIHKTLHMMRQAIIILWHPILPTSKDKAMIHGLTNSLTQEWIHHTWQHNSPQTGMQGSGILVINPPWKLDDELVATAKCLATLPPFTQMRDQLNAP